MRRSASPVRRSATLVHKSLVHKSLGSRRANPLHLDRKTVIKMTYFEDEESLKDAASRLEALGQAAIKLLQTLVEHQSIEKKSLSATAEKLNNEGFIFARDHSTFFEPRFVLTPSLAGEEALEYLEKHAHPKPAPSRLKRT